MEREMRGVYDSRYFDQDRGVAFRAVNVLWSSGYLIRTAVPASDLGLSIRGIAREEASRAARVNPVSTLRSE
jgi:hypothetical protein